MIIILEHDLGVSENSVPLNPMVLLIIIPIKWLFHWEYTQHFQTNPFEWTTFFFDETYKYRPLLAGGVIVPANSGTVFSWFMRFVFLQIADFGVI